MALLNNVENIKHENNVKALCNLMRKANTFEFSSDLTKKEFDFMLNNDELNEMICKTIVSEGLTSEEKALFCSLIEAESNVYAIYHIWANTDKAIAQNKNFDPTQDFHPGYSSFAKNLHNNETLQRFIGGLLTEANYLILMENNSMSQHTFAVFSALHDIVCNGDQKIADVILKQETQHLFDALFINQNLQGEYINDMKHVLNELGANGRTDGNVSPNSDINNDENEEIL